MPRRPLRHAFTILSALSLLLCVAVCVLWVRGSYFSVIWGRSGSLVQLTVDSDVSVCRLDGWHRDERLRRQGRDDFEFAIDDGGQTPWGFPLLGPGGFRGRAIVYRIDGHTLTLDTTTTWKPYWAGWMPLWMLATFLGLWPVAALLARFSVRFIIAGRAERRRTRGGCPGCGYDLRASPETCPECGTPVQTVA